MAWKKKLEAAIETLLGWAILGAIVAAVIWWRSPADKTTDNAAVNAPPTTAAAQQLDVRELAMRHAVITASLADCKLEPLPKEASDQWFMFLVRTDLDATTAGFARATLMVKGLGLRPKSGDCKEVAAQRAKFAGAIVEMAAQAKEFEKGR